MRIFKSIVGSLAGLLLSYSLLSAKSEYLPIQKYCHLAPNLEMPAFYQEPFSDNPKIISGKIKDKKENKSLGEKLDQILTDPVFKEAQSCVKDKKYTPECKELLSPEKLAAFKESHDFTILKDYDAMDIAVSLNLPQFNFDFNSTIVNPSYSEKAQKRLEDFRKNFLDPWINEVVQAKAKDAGTKIKPFDLYPLYRSLLEIGSELLTQSCGTNLKTTEIILSHERMDKIVNDAIGFYNPSYDV